MLPAMLLKHALLLLLLSNLHKCTASVDETSNVIVNTTLGPVEGAPSTEKSCAAFYGLPYAAPPIKDLRFRPPQTKSPWTKPRPAFAKKYIGKSCLQNFGDSFLDLPLWLEEILEKTHVGMEPMDEDCLYLNVFSPLSSGDSSVAPPQLRPVMVWFHGGSYMGGSGYYQGGMTFYDGHALCKEGDGTVIVTVNYRLNAFGFWAHGDLLSESGTAGNMGIQDQRAALEWVQKNARSFGGDPSRVTIFGESAGGSSVVPHLTTHRSAPLFSAAIVQSGGMWMEQWAHCEAQGEALVRAVDCDSAAAGKTADCMRQVNAEKILHAVLKLKWTMVNPCADGYEYPMNTTQTAVLRSAARVRKPVMVGTNMNESSIFLCGHNVTKHVNSEASFRQAVTTFPDLSHIATNSSAMDSIARLYDAPSRYGGSWQRAFIDVRTDTRFFCDSRIVLDTQETQPAFAYRLDHTMSFFSVDRCWGVPHTSDLFFLFGCFDYALTKDEKALGARMRSTWTAFAANHSAPTWPAYTKATRPFAMLDTSSGPAPPVGTQWKQEQCDLLDAVRMLR